jgi:3-oxoacyl-[acyl-carrier-protein] synthase II
LTTATERIVVTGVGVVSALGAGARSTFQRLLAGERGFRPVSLFEVGEQRCSIAAEVDGLSVADVAPRGQEASWSRTDAMALLAAREALAEAGGLQPGERLGISVGGTTGGMFETEQELYSAPHAELVLARAERLMSFPLSSTSERLAGAFGSVQRTATICSACSSGAIALAQGMAWLRRGHVDRVLAGGADGLCRLTFVGFNSLGATDPSACRPFDARRAGLGLGEAGAFLVLETERSARQRNRPILAFLSGAAVLAEAHHITHPEPTGARAAELMARALASAGLTPADIDYVNAHGTGTVQNDAMEAAALLQTFGEGPRPLVSSTKGQLGHTLGAAGALEAVLTVLSLEQGVAPETAGLERPEEPRVAHVFGGSRSAPLRAALSNSFGFGGMGCVLAFEAASTPARPVSGGALRAVVTGVCALGPLGVLDNADAAAYATQAPPPDLPEQLAFDPLAALDPERSRRFDRAAAFVTLGADRARSAAGCEAAGTGLVVGSAFGNVMRSATRSR